MRKPQIFLNLAVAVILLFTVCAALAQPRQGEITLNATMLVPGHSFGMGTLKFKGKAYSFVVKGLNVAEGSRISAEGGVFNLKEPTDLAGKYVAAGAAAIKGKAGLTMRNDKGVLINLKPDQTGVSLDANGLIIDKILPKEQ